MTLRPTLRANFFLPVLAHNMHIPRFPFPHLPNHIAMAPFALPSAYLSTSPRHWQSVHALFSAYTTSPFPLAASHCSFPSPHPSLLPVNVSKGSIRLDCFLHWRNAFRA